ncbi:unnamed protein product [Linum trigynum]|uniref:Transposase-associated domain-containing protein n=1 Tax=Linum trigynum TaxID=586398 RepID=A0AAV2GM10_9ROSI
MSRNWIKLKDRFCDEYQKGVSESIGAASKHVDMLGRTRCPCKRCNNRNFKKLEIVANDITKTGMVETYTTWIHHGDLMCSSSENAPVIGGVNIP